MTYKNSIIFCAVFFLSCLATTAFCQEDIEKVVEEVVEEVVDEVNDRVVDETAKEWDVFINNEQTINTEFLEFSPAFREDGIVFVTTKPASNKFKVLDKRINKNIMSTFQSQRDEDGTLKEPVPFAEQLMTTVHEGPMTFDKTGSTMYFTRNDYMKGKIGRAKKDGIMKLKIYSAQKNGEAWINEQELSFNSSEYNTTHPSIGVDDDILYFSSDRPGGFGGMDLYYSLKESKGWGDPINLGPNVNTANDEIFPYIHATGILFFASDGHGGEGNLDILYSNLIDSVWVSPENAGTPYNSPSDDLGFIIDRDKKNGYFSSNRDEGKGEDDIYSFFMTGDTEKFGIIDGGIPEKKMWVQVIDRATNKVIPEAKVIAMNMENLSITTDEKGNEIILSGNGETMVLGAPQQNSINGESDYNGKFPMKLKDGEYILNISKEDYVSQQLTLNTVGLDAEEVVVYLEKPVDCISLSGTLLDEANKATLSGATVVISNPNGEKYELTSDLQGKFESCLKPGKKYDVKVINNGKEVTRSSISTENQTGDAPINVTFDVPGETKITSSPSIRNTLTTGTRIELTDIYYNFNDDNLRPDATQSLDALVSILKQYPDIELELASHTDSRGGSRYNKKLSQGRAENAVQYLINQGIESYRLKPVGYGEEVIRNHCTDGVTCDENEHQFNRRTEVKVTKSNASVSVVNVNNTAPININDINSNFGEPSTTYTGNTNSTPSYTGSNEVYDINNIGSPYLLVAGSFRNRSNAEKRLAEIRSYGYGSAQFYNIVDGLITVGVQEFSSKSEGNRVKGELTSRGMKSFLKRVN